MWSGWPLREKAEKSLPSIPWSNLVKRGAPGWIWMLTYSYPSVTLDKVPQFLACKQRWIMVDPSHWAITQIFLELSLAQSRLSIRGIAALILFFPHRRRCCSKDVSSGALQNGWNDVLVEIHDLGIGRKRNCMVCSWRLVKNLTSLFLFSSVEQGESHVVEGFDSRQCIVFGAQGEENVWNKEAGEVYFCCLGGRKKCRLQGQGSGISVLHIEESRGRSAGVRGRE